MKIIKLIDDFGREIRRLRISITSSCNLNCFYCHKEGYSNGNENYFLDIEKIETLVDLIKKYEITSVKITGGEPLLHPNIIEIIKILKTIPTLKDVSITTNGTMLKKLAMDLKEAGLSRINIGCDSLHNSNVKNLKKIEQGIDESIKAGFYPIKINMVILKGINDNEILDMIDYTKKNNLILQLIELINTDNEFYEKYHLSLDSIEENLKLQSDKIEKRPNQDRNMYFLSNGAVIEIVRPMHNPKFCAKCHTLRVTNDFQFQPCLNCSDNLIKIDNNIEKSLLDALKNRRPYYG